MAMLINGQPGEQISALDRGLAYGDGIYRTIEIRAGQPRLWAWQYRRLAADASRLQLPVPDAALLLDEIGQLAGGLAQGVAKIVLTRGVGARGYAMPADCQPTRMVSVTAWAGYPPERARDGVHVRWCDTRLACQPRLAGIKHLNRLENVLARSEWSDPDIHEGLMLDTRGLLVEATMSNVYLVQGQQIITPRLDQNGVQGMLRDWLFAHAPQLGYPLTETEILPAQLQAADAVFLSNSLIGLWPVVSIDGQSLPHDHLCCAQLQALLASQA
ncbi:aminodeoxychorismate lyase [Aquitalea sp. LB_tupeE]|uniref:aminodeoxychorismate lyase n=1 Tax=Aquitalea sp. LB_tupeE TaxID=2748078 RepID=UPI0015C091CC|nr:aminodeoxychorismate lyase [Aquitalea sp. LB_tupeE]NWK78773.1 aminodeoxychorismate lyase [Aquitalea sp. LB_tupeE]